MLHEWQKRIASSVRRGGASEGLFCAGEARFPLYREGYWLRVSESLQEDFPLTERLLGARGFEARVREFLPSDRGYELELGEVTPSFADWLLVGAKPTLRRAIALDLLAVETRRSPEPAAGSRLSLHPSARFFVEEQRVYVFWRDGEGQVLRERISMRMYRVMECFREPVSAESLAERVVPLGEDREFVRETIENCSEAGLLTYL